jgi:RecA/RadA recombinase
MADGAVVEEVQVVSTGSLGLDIALGVTACHAGVWLKFMARNLQVKPL